MHRSRTFAWKPFLKQIAAIAIPVALQNTLSSTGTMVDTMMIGALGQESVGAVGLCAQFSSLMVACYWGLVGGGMLFYAQYWGAQDDDGINRSYGISITCQVMIGVLFCLAGFLMPEVVMRLYTDKAEIQQIGVEYLRTVCFAYPLQVYSIGMAALLRTTERVKIPLIAAICSVLTNVLLNYCFISGHLGFPALGIRGAALATVLAALVNVLVTGALAIRNGHPYIFAFNHHFHWTKAAVKEYFIKCAPIIANELLIGIGNMLISVVLGRQSVEAIAALAVFRTLEGFIIGFFAGFSNAASILVGKEVGAGNLDTAYERAWRLIYLCQFVIFLSVLVLLALHTPLLTMMSLHDESFSICFGMLLIYGVAVLIRMGNWAQNDTYRSAGDAAYGTILEIVFMYAMVLPCVWLSGMVLHWPFLVIFALCYADEPIRYVMMQVHLYNGKWVKPVTPQGLGALPAFRKKHLTARERS